MSRADIKRISGEHIDLVDIEPIYFEDIVKWRNDPENQRCFFSQEVWTIQGETQWFQKYKTDPTDLTFVILLKSGKPVGMVALYKIDDISKTAEFGRLLIGDKASRRLDIGREASILCLDLAINKLGLRKVYLEVHDWNITAIRLYEQLGFVTVARTTRHDAHGGIQQVRCMNLEVERSHGHCHLV